MPVYDSYGQARAAVDAVEKAGVPASDVSIVANKYVSAEHADVDEVSGAAKGAGIGGAWAAAPGCWPASACWRFPGLGPVVAAGWLAATAVGAAAGAATGGIVGALVDAGVDREHADVYSESVRRGGTMVTSVCATRRPAASPRCWRPTSPSTRWPAATSTARLAGRRSTRRRRPTGRAKPRSTVCGRTGRAENDTNQDKGRRKACPSSLRSAPSVQ